MTTATAPTSLEHLEFAATQAWRQYRAAVIRNTPNRAATYTAARNADDALHTARKARRTATR